MNEKMRKALRKLNSLDMPYSARAELVKHLETICIAQLQDAQKALKQVQGYKAYLDAFKPE